MLRNIIQNSYIQYNHENDPSLNRDEYFMSIALLTAHYSPYDPLSAVVIVKDDEIIVT